MGTTAKIISCYAADTSGVCSALYELGGLIVVHDASGCNSTYSTHDEPRWEYLRSNIFISALTEMDAVMGNDEKLINDTVMAAEDLSPKFIAICGSPMPMMTGVDYEAIACEVEERTGIPTFAVKTNGIETYIKGAGDAYLEYAKRFITDVPADRKGVNILGATPLDLSNLRMVSEVISRVMRLGFDVTSCLGMKAVRTSEDNRPDYSTAMDYSTIGAEASLVISEAGLPVARYLEKEFGIPFVTGFPIGEKFCKKLAEDLRQAIETRKSSFSHLKYLTAPADESKGTDLIIGESIFAGSIATQRLIGFGQGSRIISNTSSYEMPESEHYLKNITEEQLELILAGKSDIMPKPVTMIADPMFGYILPNREGPWFEAVPHRAFSGRCFDETMPNMREIEELIC